jgi:hypothetical protein
MTRATLPTLPSYRSIRAAGSASFADTWLCRHLSFINNALTLQLLQTGNPSLRGRPWERAECLQLVPSAGGLYTNFTRRFPESTAQFGRRSSDRYLFGAYSVATAIAPHTSLEGLSLHWQL